MSGIKCCPKCGSANINPAVFYRPSIWKCADCGYEGAFIIEDGELAEKMRGRYRKGCDIIDWTEGECCMGHWGGSTDNWPRNSEDHVNPVAVTVKDNNMGLRP